MKIVQKHPYKTIKWDSLNFKKRSTGPLVFIVTLIEKERSTGPFVFIVTLIDKKLPDLLK